MANANVSLQIIPRGSDKDIYDLVDRGIGVIRDSGVPYIVGPMGTTMEGDYDELMEIVKKAQEAVVAAGSDRVLSVIKVDYRPSGVDMEEKVRKYRQE